MTGAPGENVAPDPQDTIPAELRELDQWIGYRMVDRSGRPTKVPRRCDVSGLAAVDNPATWSTFPSAVGALARLTLDGLGVVLTDDDPFVGVDLDDCVDADLRLHPAAVGVVEGLDSYTEWSPSGSGLHVFVRGSLASSRHRTTATGWGGHFEVYDRSRFFTVTGDHLPGTPSTINSRQAELDALIETLLPSGSRPHAISAAVGGQLELDDTRLLERARRAKNGAHFSRLYDGGGVSGYDSQSEAELALCGILAFWTRGDAHRIDRLFRHCALFRAKWDEQRGDTTYGAQTIDVAIAGCPAFYTSREARLRVLLEGRTPEQLNETARGDLA